MTACEKLAVPPPHIARPTASGWCRSTVLPDYIDEIILPYTGGQPCLLILDCYKAHRLYREELYDSRYNIEFAFVPESMTATLSPLDVGINPEAKSRGKGDFRELSVQRRFDNNPVDSGAESWRLATGFAINSFNSIDTKRIVSSFEDSIGINIDLCRQAGIDRERERQEKEAKAREAIAQIDAIMRDFV